MTDLSAYQAIASKVDQTLQGAPYKDGNISEDFISFLTLIYTPAEAEVAQHLNNFPQFMTVDQIAEASGRSADEIRPLLESMHVRYALMGGIDGQSLLTPFYYMNYHHRYPEIREDDLEAARLYKKFFIEDEFYRRYETSKKGTSFFRTLPVDRTIESGQQVLSHEEAKNRIKGLSTSTIALVPCPCRTRMEKMGERECQDMPIGYCIIPGANGQKFIDLGYGKPADKQEAITYLNEMVDHGCIVNSDNYKGGDPMVICLCCGCCCSFTRGRNKWGNPESIMPSNFIPIADENCVACGVCVERCPFDALFLDEESDRSRVNPDLCIGCGVCAAGCPTGALKLHRFDRTQTFENVVEFALKVIQDNSAE